MSPRYDRHCEACGATWETVERMSARRKHKCPRCGRRQGARLPATGLALRTDTSLPAGMRRMAELQGIRLHTREDYREMQRRGMDFVSERDADVMTRGGPEGRVRDHMERILRPIQERERRIEIHSSAKKRAKGRKSHADAAA